MSVQLKTATLNGQKIGYSSATEFRIQVGKGPKGAYKTQHIFTGNLAQAVHWYNGINLGNGYKKRLLMEGKVLARAHS